jgi:hypothetical protein
MADILSDEEGLHAQGDGRNDHTHRSARAETAIVIRDSHAAVMRATVNGAARRVEGLVPITTITKLINPPRCVPEAE